MFSRGDNSRLYLFWLVAFEKAWSYIPLFLILYFFLQPITYNSPLSTPTLIIYFVVVTSLISSPSIISSIRLKTQEIKKTVFFEASKTLGAGRHRIVWLHIFPQLKDSLTVMFILEIVYVITIMGQLALMNIFIGGTIVQFDPLIYQSITKELAGLVGQSRGNVYGTQHVLVIPLISLLLTTISFSLLANGLKNRYQSNYQRTPWIKTGQEPLLKPIRKNHSSAKNFWPPNGEKLALFILALFFIGAGTFVNVIYG